jgi:hypothetical protein
VAGFLASRGNWRAEVARCRIDRPRGGEPHPLVKTKLWALLWCAQHESVHAGQIGLLRRQLGYSPLW